MISVKSFFFLKYAQWKVKREYKTHLEAICTQEKFLKTWIHKNRKTAFGKDHNFDKIETYRDFTTFVPIRNYEEYLPYIERIKQGDHKVLSTEAPIYLLMTSGTTAGSKYIPISKTGVKHQIEGAMMALCFYAVHKKSAEFMKYKMIFLQGSPELEDTFVIPSGRLSGVVYHHVPKFFRRNKLPSYKINTIPNWQEKIDKIVDETWREDISILGGIPPWCIQYFEKLLQYTGNTQLKNLYPHLEMYIYGGLDFSSYRDLTQRLLGEGIACLQTYPASEGFFAVQDSLVVADMLLLLDQGNYYEFKPFNDPEEAEVAVLKDVKLGVRYELIVTNNSGLYRYAIGDLVEFTTLHPFRIRVVGRTSQYISAFGEHVIAYEIEKTMENALSKFGLSIVDYYVYPDIEEKRYEWLIEFDKTLHNDDLLAIARFLDTELAHLNKYYAHLINGQIINNSLIVPIRKGTFKGFRESIGKEGGQNKVVRISNNDTFAKMLFSYNVSR